MLGTGGIVTGNWWRRLGVVVMVVVVAVGPMVLATRAAGSRLEGAHWARSSRPFTLEVGDNVRGGWENDLDRAVAGWNRAGVARLRVVRGEARNTRACPITPGRIEVCSGDYGQTNWLGLATIELTRNSKHIVGAAIQLNDSYFRQPDYNDRTAKRHTVCHELGHALGLDHVNYASCMNTSGRSVFNDASPVRRDFAKLRRLYRHRDNTTTVGRGQAREGDAEPTTTIAIPNAVGPVTGTEVISEPLGHGRERVTIITWVADGAGE